jgi:hypothetical protein
MFSTPHSSGRSETSPLFAQAEATWLVLVATLTGRTEKEAQCFLQKDAATAKQEIMPLAKTTAIESYELADGVCRRPHLQGQLPRQSGRRGCGP